MILTHLVLFSFLDGAGGTVVEEVVEQRGGGPDRKRRKAKRAGLRVWTLPNGIRFSGTEEEYRRLFAAPAEKREREEWQPPVAVPSEAFRDLAQANAVVAGIERAMKEAAERAAIEAALAVQDEEDAIAVLLLT